jgi:hypothetical protein
MNSHDIKQHPLTVELFDPEGSAKFEAHKKMVEEKRSRIYNTVKELLKDQLWTSSGADFEEVIGANIKFDHDKMTVDIDGDEFGLCLLPRRDIRHITYCGCDCEDDMPPSPAAKKLKEGDD